MRTADIPDEESEEKKNIAKFYNLMLRPNIGELLGSFFFSFLACFAGQYQRSNDLVYPFLSGFSLYISRSLVGHLTPAHLNPAVTFLHWLRNEIPLVLAVSFCFVQLIGFLFGVSLFRSLVTQTEFNDYIVMYEIVAVEGIRKINRLQAFLLEVVLSIIFFTSHSLEDRQESTVAAAWGFIQFVSYPLYGFTSNVTLLLVTSTVSYVFSPLTTPSFLLLYLNVFASLIAVLLTWCLDL
ncbi:CRE-AQP-12 protein [Caenorhabditis remanei]|uniref:CRE-AQP-12 protein n=1 Tax=Caenorhabditis remanei TaxID=31234 RepID=E3M1D8_CAERE|nr:CRE-AQP-12 protein [Caenorhabditis remanei]